VNRHEEISDTYLQISFTLLKFTY